MVGLGTIFIAVMAVARLPAVAQGNCSAARWMLWILLLMFPFPYIANTAGWMTAEIGRQPWLVYGLLRTDRWVSPRNGLRRQRHVHLLGFMGMYTLLAILFLFLIRREIEHGPEPSERRIANLAEPSPSRPWR